MLAILQEIALEGMTTPPILEAEIAIGATTPITGKVAHRILEETQPIRGPALQTEALTPILDHHPHEVAEAPQDPQEDLLGVALELREEAVEDNFKPVTLFHFKDEKTLSNHSSPMDSRINLCPKQT